MLIPVECKKCGQKIWVEFSVKAEERVYLGSERDLKQYLLKEINIKDVHEEDIVPELREQFFRLIEHGEDYKRALKIVSEVYGVPVLILEDVLADLIDYVKVR